MESAYRVIEGSTAHELRINVNAVIKEGWIPQGGLTVVRSKYGKLGGYDDFYQAVIKEAR